MVGAVVRAASVLVVRFALWRAGGGARWVVRVWRCGWASRGRAGGSGIIPRNRWCLLSSLPSHASRCNARRPSQPSSRDRPMGPGSCNTRGCTGIQLDQASRWHQSIWPCSNRSFCSPHSTGRPMHSHTSRCNRQVAYRGSLPLPFLPTARRTESSRPGHRGSCNHQLGPTRGWRR